MSEIKKIIESGTAADIEKTVENALNQAENLNKQLNSFVRFERERALERAVQVAKDSSENQTLRGVPIAIKDNICEKDAETTCASKILSGYKPQYNATVVDKLLKAGAVSIGKANMDEFAMGSSNENSAFGVVRNPWNTDYVPGGSSGGSAAAVASGAVPVALGSDTGGSVRLPAAFCGIYGIKPTYGRVSRYGLVAFGSSLDQIGVFGRTTADVAEVLRVIAGRDPLDSTTADVPVPDYVSEMSQDVKGVKIGVPRALFGEGVNEEVREKVEKAIDAYRSLGAEIVDVELPNIGSGIAVYYIIATAEASSNLARFDGVRYGFRTEDARDLRESYRKTREEGFGAEVKRRIMLGTYVLSSGYYDAYYAKAQKVRTLIRRDYAQALSVCDAVIMPSSPTTAFKIGEKTDDPLAMYLMDIYTVTANLAGVPGISVPCGISSEGLPVGLQLIAGNWQESLLFRLSGALEKNLEAMPKPTVFSR